MNRKILDKQAGDDTTLKASLLIANISEERKESGTIKADTGELDNNVTAATSESDKTIASPSEKVESNGKDKVLSSGTTEVVIEKFSEGYGVGLCKAACCSEGELSNKVEHQKVHKESEATNPEKDVKVDDKSQKTDADTTRTSTETGKANGKTSEAECETVNTINTPGKLAILGKTSQNKETPVN